MQITMQCACPASQGKAKLQMTLNYSRIAKEIAMVSGILAMEGARHCFIHASGVDIHKKDKKVFEPNESIIARNRTITREEP